MKINVKINYDWIMGYLKYGHKEGIIDIPDDEYEEFKKDPNEYLWNRALIYDLEFVIDEYSLEDYGDVESITYEKAEE